MRPAPAGPGECARGDLRIARDPAAREEHPAQELTALDLAVRASPGIDAGGFAKIAGDARPGFKEGPEQRAASRVPGPARILREAPALRASRESFALP